MEYDIHIKTIQPANNYNKSISRVSKHLFMPVIVRLVTVFLTQTSRIILSKQEMIFLHAKLYGLAQAVPWWRFSGKSSQLNLDAINQIRHFNSQWIKPIVIMTQK